MKKTLSPIPDEGNGASGSSSVEATVNLHTVKENLQNTFQTHQLHKEKLGSIEEEIAKLQKFRKDYEHLLKRLQTLPDKASHEVMVPFGSMAFMPGRLIHTNEILVLLGDNWFADRSAKQASDIVRRRLKDCDEKIKTAESARKVHSNMLNQIEEVLGGEAGEQVEIIEELTEEQFIKSQEEHRKKVASFFSKQRESASDPEAGSSSRGTSSYPEAGSSSRGTSSYPEYMDKLSQKHRLSYEDIMKRLDQLELEEEEGEEEEEEEEEEAGSEDTEECEEDGEKEVKFDNEISDEERTMGSEGEMDESSRAKRAKLKRRVSWADDVRTLFTVIPDDDSEDICRIKYSSKPLSLPLAELSMEGLNKADDTGENIQSPSDIYKVFAQGASAPEPQPRGILKKSASLPIQDVSDGWCCPPKPLDIDADTPEDLPPPPPSPPPKRMQSLKPAFSYRVMERKFGDADAEEAESTTKKEVQPKKVSKFKASRSKK